MPLWILADPDRCSGCGICEIVCSLEHEGKIWPEASRIKVLELFPGVTIPTVCVHCKEKKCVSACQTGALFENERGNLELDPEKCIKCMKCVSACPGGNIFPHPKSGIPIFCDLCGGDPKCVEACNFLGYSALNLLEADVVTRDLIPRDPFELHRDLYEKIYGDAK